MGVSSSVFRKKIVWSCLIIVGLLGLIVMQMLWQRRGYQVDYGVKSYVDISNSWIYEDGESADFSSLREEEGKSTIYYQIPKIKESTTLFYRSHNMYTKVFLEDELIYETDNTYSDRPPGTRWNLVKIHPEQVGQILKLQITAAYSGDSPTLDNIYWGDRAAIILSIMQQKVWAILTCIAICLVGFVMLILDIFLNYGNKTKNHGICCLGIFSICIGGWSLIETNVLQLLVGDTQILQSIDNLLLILCVMPLILYANWTYDIFKYRFVRLYCIIHILYLVACIILPIAGVTDWHGLLPIARVFIGINAIGFITFAIRNNWSLIVSQKMRSPVAFFQLAGVFSICISAVLELLRFNVSGAMDRAMVLRFGLLLFILCFAISSLVQAYKLILQGMEYDNVRKLAYSDALTQLGNHVAYLERLEECVEKHISQLGIVYLDVNNLKKVNDEYGHEEGNVLIRTAADVIKNSFSSYGRVYRIGGDEFCVLLDQNPEEGYEQGIDEFRNQIKAVNESGDYIFHLQIAHGFACCEADSMKTVKNAVNTADENMYRDKIQLKQQTAMDEN